MKTYIVIILGIVPFLTCQNNTKLVSEFLDTLEDDKLTTFEIIDTFLEITVDESKKQNTYELLEFQLDAYRIELRKIKDDKFKVISYSDKKYASQIGAYGLEKPAVGDVLFLVHKNEIFGSFLVHNGKIKSIATIQKGNSRYFMAL